MDPLSGNLRMTFDSPDLINGVSLVPALVGLYALSQVLVTIEDVFMGRKLSTAEISRKRMPLSEIWTNRAALLRGSIIGTFIGIVRPRAQERPHSRPTAKPSAIQSIPNFSARAPLKASRPRNPPTTPSPAARSSPC